MEKLRQNLSNSWQVIKWWITSMYTRVGNVGGRMRRDYLNTMLKYTVLRSGINRSSLKAFSVPLTKFCGKSKFVVETCTHSWNSLSKLWKWHIWFSEFLFLNKKLASYFMCLLIDWMIDWLLEECCMCLSVPQCGYEVRESVFFSHHLSPWGWTRSGLLSVASTYWTVFWTFKVSLYMY